MSDTYFQAREKAADSRDKTIVCKIRKLEKEYDKKTRQIRKRG